MRILAVGPHPDDIEWGMGGTLLKLAGLGHEIRLVVLTKGEAGGDPGERTREMTAAAGILGARIMIGWCHDTKVLFDKGLIEYLECNIKPGVDELYIPWVDDTHQDHINLAKAGMAAGRFIKRVLFYETSTSLSFLPDVFVDIGAEIQVKGELLRCHDSQLRKYCPTPYNLMTSMEATARYRGCQAGVELAEGFKAHRLLRDL